MVSLSAKIEYIFFRQKSSAMDLVSKFIAGNYPFEHDCNRTSIGVTILSWKQGCFYNFTDAECWTFVNNNYESRQRKWSSLGHLLFDEYCQCNKLHGVQTHYYPTGQIYSRTTYIDGMERGLTEWFNIDGTKHRSETRYNLKNIRYTN